MLDRNDSRWGKVTMRALTAAFSSGVLMLAGATASADTGETMRLAETDAATDTATLSTITITAEKLGRSLLKSSTSAIVIDSAALEERPLISGSRDLVARIPNITATGTGNFAPAVRGVDGTGPAYGSDAFLAGTRPRLNVQIDGRPASYNEVVFGDVGIWDVQQVEVLRGAQSALQGRNAIAGTIAIKTQDPTYEPEAHLRVIGGNFSNRDYAAAVSAPIVDEQLAFRIAASRSTSESFVTMPPYAGVSDPSKRETTTVRVKLLIEPKALSDSSTILTFNYAKTRAPQSEAVRQPYDRDVSSLAAMPVFQPRTVSGIANTTWRLSDDLKFVNTLAYTDFNIKRFAPKGAGNADIDGHELVVEPTLRFDEFDGSLTGLGGVYFFRAHQDEFIDLLGGGTFNDSTRTAAAFGEATYAVSQLFDVTFGARYEQEHRLRNGLLSIFSIDLDETYKAFLPKLVLSWHPSANTTLGTVASRGYNGGGAGFTYNPPFASYTFKPEYVVTYEAFARTLMANNSVSLTANVFYSDYKDIQLPFQLGPLSTVIRNAQKAKTYGAELGARWQAVAGLQFFGDMGLLSTDVTKDTGSGIEGKDLARAPTFTGDAGVTYHHASGFEFGVDARYSDTYFSDAVNTPRGKVAPYCIANLQVAYSFPHTRVFGYLKNVFNSGDPLLFIPGAAPANDVAILQQPRTYGAGVQVDF